MSSFDASSTMNSRIPATVGNYAIGELIGTGTFSEVRRAMDLNTAENACVKIIDKSQFQDESDVLHQQQEIDIMSRLSHPNIVQYFGINEDEEFLYIFMEYCEGRCLLDLINDNGELSNSVALYIFKQIIHALVYMHDSKFYHRDIKPENIIVDANYAVKLIDFGFGTFSGDENEEGEGTMRENSLLTTFCGSFLYAAPELVASKPYDGAAVDVWSAGVVLYAMVMGQLPFDDSNIPLAIQQILNAEFVLADTINMQCADLIRKMLCVDPEKRIKTRDILDHPWIRLHGKTTMSMVLPLSKIKQKKDWTGSFIRSNPNEKTPMKLNDTKWQSNALTSSMTQYQMNNVGTQRRYKPLTINGRAKGKVGSFNTSCGKIVIPDVHSNGMNGSFTKLSNLIDTPSDLWRVNSDM